MPDEIIDLDECRQRKKEEHDRLVHWRELFLDQERSEMRIGELPCISRHLTHLDLLLMEDPLTDLGLRIASIARCAFISARLYEEEPEPIIKHILLLSIRQHHRQFMRLPAPVRKAGAWIWGTWLDVLEEEEERHGAA